MRAGEFGQAVSTLTFGKVLPNARYIVRPRARDLPPQLMAEIQRALSAANPDARWNLLKLHTKEYALTFLTYPEFETEPHPALAAATKINLGTGTIVSTDYSQRANPPILHRKETFLPPDDPRISEFVALTRQEEDAGLYRDTSRIGLRLPWSALLKQKGLKYEGQRLICIPANSEPILATSAVEVNRYRTAIKRYDLSRPVKRLLERGLLRTGDTFFDYGCGHGMDVKALGYLGFQAAGWDPAFRPDSPQTPAAVVNLGYVLNVIEHPAERLSTLRAAFALTERVLLVSTLVAGQENSAHTRPYGDGFLTKTNTFQKFFAPGELESLIEQALDAEVLTLELGQCVVFRDPEVAEVFDAARRRRRFDWSEIGIQLRFAVPANRTRRQADCYELHRALFETFWQVSSELGRAPEPSEFARWSEVRQAAGSIQRALSLVVAHHGKALWEKIRAARTEDTLVYLAMTHFRKRFQAKDIPWRMKQDIREFFGRLTQAQARARELLFAAGDPGEIDLACEQFQLGWQDRDALYIHRSLLNELPPVLRIFVYCAANRYGDPAQADVIKLHKRSGKITFQHYDDFAGKPLPELQTRIKVNLRNLFVEVFDHSVGTHRQLLYFKERLVAKNHPKRAAMEKFSVKLRKLGLDEGSIGFGPNKESFDALLKVAGLNANLNPIRRAGS